MTEKVLGFRKKDAENKIQYTKNSIKEFYCIREDKLVPVVSVEEHERFKEEANAVILQKNRKIMEWENQQVVSLAWLKKQVREKRRVRRMVKKLSKDERKFWIENPDGTKRTYMYAESLEVALKKYLISIYYHKDSRFPKKLCIDVPYSIKKWAREHLEETRKLPW